MEFSKNFNFDKRILSVVIMEPGIMSPAVLSRRGIRNLGFSRLSTKSD